MSAGIVFDKPGTTTLAPLLALAGLVVGCATSPSPLPMAAEAPRPKDAPAKPVVDEADAAPAASETELKEEPVAVESREMPTSCAADGPICTPPEAFVKRLCQKTTPNVALAMFHKDAPWTRAYVRADMEAWYASARRSQPRELRYAEEVVVVRHRGGGSGGVQISGSGSYDVYRFDGTCVSLMEGELSLRRPSTPDVAPIRFKRLAEEFKQALKEDRRIGFRYGKQREACRDHDPGRCERATVQLSRMVADYVRGGGNLPPLRFIP